MSARPPHSRATVGDRPAGSKRPGKAALTAIPQLVPTLLLGQGNGYRNTGGSQPAVSTAARAPASAQGGASASSVHFSDFLPGASTKGN